MVEPSSVGWGIISGAGQLYKNREGVLAAWDWIARKFWRKTRIAVTGPAGVGKSVLRDALTERMGVEYRPPGQSEQVERHRRSVGKKRLEFIVLPGQDASPRMDGENELLEKPVDGLIYTACFGFTTIRADIAKRHLIAHGQSTLEAFREAQKQADLEHLDQTISYVRRMFARHAQPRWMIVAVTKFDLFSTESRAAEEYYSPAGTGPFVERMKSLHHRLGTDRFRWSAMPVCAHPEDFSWNNTKARSHFSLDERADSVRRFFTHVEHHCGQ
ncbi:hypothetical protein WME99_21025 [Sorangium sp. So ce136]|uniref:hypothetical protein n=1 Tax=Sorangium sp. So ce136 TaxID=3133284 RepID=UPI003F08F853